MVVETPATQEGEISSSGGASGGGDGGDGGDGGGGGAETLEQELSLSTSDLRSHAWYHGRLGRQEAEAHLHDDGEFLVRESASQPGEFALSCRWNSNNIHFMINKVRMQPGTVHESVHYFLEEESFETIPHLVTAYVSERALSVASGARIRHPVPRSHTIGGAAAHQPQTSPIWRHTLLKNQRAASVETVHRSNSLARSHSGSLPRLQPDNQPLYTQPGRVRPTAPPPKPVRPQQVEAPAKPGTSGVSECSGETRTSAASGTSAGHGVLTESELPARPGTSTESVTDSGSSSESSTHPADTNILLTQTQRHCIPVVTQQSAFDPAAFDTLLLPLGENAPLDSTALRGVTLELLEAPAPALAAHMTWWDLNLLQPEGTDCGVRVTSGIELITLPQGRQLRQDLLERAEWLSAFVVASIVGLDNNDERVQVMAKWISVAIETRSSLGNLYGFATVVQALCAPQVQRLCVSWHRVRQRYTPLAVQFDAQLRPWLHALLQASLPEPPNTCLPHLTSLATLLDEPLQPAADDDTDQLQLLLLQLAAGRQLATDVERYRRSAKTARAARPADDAGTRSDLFRTELHQRLLLGSRAARAPQHERRGPLLTRVQQVLEVLAEQRDTEEG